MLKLLVLTFLVTLAALVRCGAAAKGQRHGTTMMLQKDSSRMLRKKKKGRKNCAESSIVVCNRASGSISILDADSGDLMTTMDLPGAVTPEPMYVFAIKGMAYVADRANNALLAYDSNFNLVKTIPIGRGAFHLCGDQTGKFAWVVCDIDKTITVVDLVELLPIKTIPIPTDLSVAGGIPHDLTITWDGRSAFVTIIGVEGGADEVLKYDTETYELVARRTLAGDPHVVNTWRTDILYVAQQDGDLLSFLSQDDLSDVSPNITITDAHGQTMFSTLDTVLYITDITPGDDGTVGLYAVDLDTNQVVASVTEGIPPTPHNIAGTGDKFFLTHSGPTNNLVTVYSYSLENPTPVLIKTVEVGLNPFGLDYMEAFTCVDAGKKK